MWTDVLEVIFKKVCDVKQQKHVSPSECYNDNKRILVPGRPVYDSRTGVVVTVILSVITPALAQARLLVLSPSKRAGVGVGAGLSSCYELNVFAPLLFPGGACVELGLLSATCLWAFAHSLWTHVECVSDFLMKAMTVT